MLTKPALLYCHKSPFLFVDATFNAYFFLDTFVKCVVELFFFPRRVVSLVQEMTVNGMKRHKYNSMEKISSGILLFLL